MARFFRRGLWTLAMLPLLAISTTGATIHNASASDPVTPGAGPHSYPDVWCWDGRGAPLGTPSSSPKILLIFADFSKRVFANGEYLSWRPYWRDRYTGAWTVEPFAPYRYFGPYEDNIQGLWIDAPYTAWPGSGHPDGGYSWLPGHYYDVGASYAWWDAPTTRWIIDNNWTPNVIQGDTSGYSRMTPGLFGRIADNICSLDPSRFDSTFTVTGVGRTASSGSVGPLSQPLQQLSTLKRSSRSAFEAETAESGPRQARVKCHGSAATIVGTTGPDSLVGSRGDDVIVAGGGDDLILGRGGRDVICGDAGDDGILGGAGDDRIHAGSGSDAVIGQRGDDVANGGTGIDIIEGSEGSNRLDGGNDEALDIIAYLDSSVGTSLDFASGTAQSEGIDYFDGFNAVVGSNGDDTLVGTEGEQWFVPLEGDDRVDGNGGTDVIAFLDATRGVTVNLSVGRADGQGADDVANVEVLFATPFADQLVGSDNYEYLSASSGNDVIDGSGGLDTIDGGEGEDACTNAGYYSACENHEDGGPLPERVTRDSGLVDPRPDVDPQEP